MEIIKLGLREAVKAIKEGKVLVCPTDTVYGLICDATNKNAVERLYKIKQRPKWKPLPVFVNDIKMAKRIAYINKEQENFLKKVWSGAVTAVLLAKKTRLRQGFHLRPSGFGGQVGGQAIGLRIPNHKFVLNLVKHIGPLAESSANISGKPASTKIKEVLRQFKARKSKPDLVIDAGNLPASKPSKVIDLTTWPPKILRY